MLHEYWNLSPSALEVSIPASAILMVPLFPPEPMQIARISVGAKYDAAPGSMQLALYRVGNFQFERDFTPAELEFGNMSEQTVNYELLHTAPPTALTASFAARHLVFQPNFWLREGTCYALGIAASTAWIAYGGAPAALGRSFRRASNYPLPNRIDFKQQTHRNNTGDPAVVLRTMRACRFGGG